jgi:hypothetical protein
MTNSIRKMAAASMLSLAVLFTAIAPSAMAQTHRSRRQVATSYDQDREYEVRRNRDYERNRRNRDYDYDDDYYRRDSRTDAWKRTGIGAAVGAAGGGLMGGKKGALIGAAIGAAGGYIYHRKKENDRRY